LETVSVQGRIAGGVRGMNLDEEDEVCWAGQLKPGSQVILFSDRGWGKRMPEDYFEPQNRGGKGIRCFPFQKNGANGRVLAGVWKMEEGQDCDLLISQVRSPMTRISAAEILLQNRQGKGMPYIMAILDDIITGILGVDKSAIKDEST